MPTSSQFDNKITQSGEHVLAGATVHIIAPSRLHFGLLSFGGGPATEFKNRRRFGGLGVMILQPDLRFNFRAAASLEVCGPSADRVEQFARRFAAGIGRAMPLGVRIEVIAAPPEHVGLGSGTQLGLAVAAGLSQLWNEPPREPAEWARLVGRGERSAIGTHGFARGGLLFERGKLPGESVSHLTDRVDFPATWRFVLLRPSDQQGLFGERERTAFERLNEVSESVTRRLIDLAGDELLPAAVRADFDAFSRAVYQYGHEAGQCFANVQGGAFASPPIEQLVGWVRSLGIEGVGQSSWGPTVYVLLNSEANARQFVEEFQQSDRATGFHCLITAADNHGLRLSLEG